MENIFVSVAEIGPTRKPFADFRLGEFLAPLDRDNIGIKVSDDQIVWVKSGDKSGFSYSGLCKYVPASKHYRVPSRVDVQVTL